MFVCPSAGGGEKIAAKSSSESVEVCSGGHLGEGGEGRGREEGSIQEGGGALTSTVAFPAVTSHRKAAQEVESDRDAEMRSPGMGRWGGGV